MRFYSTEDGEAQPDLTPMEDAQLRAVFERRSGRRFYLRGEKTNRDKAAD
jgi:hypothetical protein